VAVTRILKILYLKKTPIQNLIRLPASASRANPLGTHQDQEYPAPIAESTPQTHHISDLRSSQHMHARVHARHHPRPHPHPHPPPTPHATRLQRQSISPNPDSNPDPNPGPASVRSTRPPRAHTPCLRPNMAGRNAIYFPSPGKQCLLTGHGSRVRVGGDAALWEARTCVGRGRVLFSCNVKRAGDMGMRLHDRFVRVCGRWLL
jgi:hypothetical protein